MKVSGSEATAYDAVRTDSFATVNTGPLQSADEDTGSVSWTDKAGETKSVTLGDHMIRLILRTRYRR